MTARDVTLWEGPVTGVMALLLLPAASAFSVTVALPPHDLGILAWVALAPLFCALRNLGTWMAAGASLLYGFAFCLGAFSWVNSIPGVNFANFVIMLAAFGVYFLLFGLAYRLVARTGGAWCLIASPALWVTVEYIRSNLGFMAWPWSLLGHSQYRILPVIQVADITGVYGVSFIIVMTNEVMSRVPDLLARTKSNPRMSTETTTVASWSSQTLIVAGLVAITLAYGCLKVMETEDAGHLRVAVVQPNLVSRDKMTLVEQAAHMKIYDTLTREAAGTKPTLIVWPSSSLPAPFEGSRLVRHSVRKIAHETGCYLLVGGAGQDKASPRKEGYEPYSNSEFLISPSGQVQGEYHKIRLLPFNEYLPLRTWIEWPEWITRLKASFVAGERFTLFDVSGARFGTPICWENLFPDLFRRFVKEGAHFMVSVTNEAFMGKTSAAHQTLAMTTFRAVENRVAIVRASPTGVSAFIDRNGQIIETLRDSSGDDLFVSGILVQDVPLSKEKTFYTTYGDVFAILAMLAGSLVTGACLLRHWLEPFGMKVRNGS